MRNRIILISLALLLLTAIGAAPRYLEELRIGGGYNDPSNGGADFESDGDIFTDGALTVDGTTTLDGPLYVNDSDIVSTQDTLYLNPDGAGRLLVGPTTTQLENSNGRLWFVNKSGASSHFRFFMPDSLANVQDFGSLWCVATDSVDSSEDATFKLALIRAGVYDYDVFSVNSDGDGRFDGSISANGGDVIAGVDGSIRGLVSVTRGTGGDQAGSVKLQSRNGTSWYLFVEDDGTLRVHNALPASNSDGAIVGLQN